MKILKIESTVKFYSKEYVPVQIYKFIHPLGNTSIICACT